MSELEIAFFLCEFTELWPKLNTIQRAAIIALIDGGTGMLTCPDDFIFLCICKSLLKDHEKMNVYKKLKNVWEKN